MRSSSGARGLRERSGQCRGGAPLSAVCRLRPQSAGPALPLPRPLTLQVWRRREHLDKLQLEQESHLGVLDELQLARVWAGGGRGTGGGGGRRGRGRGGGR